VTLEIENGSTDIADVLFLIGGRRIRLATAMPSSAPLNLKVAIPSRLNDPPFGQFVVQRRGEPPYNVGNLTNLDRMVGSRVHLTIGSSAAFDSWVLQP
jgi:hypothetical protein